MTTYVRTPSVLLRFNEFEQIGVDLTRVRRHRDVSDGDVFGLTRSMAHDVAVSALDGDAHAVERLGEGTDLV